MFALPLQHLPLQEAVKVHAVLVVCKRSSTQVLMDGPEPTHITTTGPVSTVTAVRHTQHEINKKTESKQVRVQQTGDRE